MILSNGKIIAQNSPSNLVKDIMPKMHILVVILKLIKFNANFIKIKKLIILKKQ